MSNAIVDTANRPKSGASLNVPAPGRPRYGWKLLASLFLVFWVVFFALRTLHWREVNDPAQFHYLIFLMAHGMMPYRDLLEMNLPGTYMMHWTVMHVLGAGDLAWRCFDLMVMGVAAIAMIVIARSSDWFAGVLAAALFILFHGRDGAGQMGQRDLVMSVLLLAAYAFLFEALRRSRPYLMLGFGLTAGYAATLKPTPLPFAFLLLILAAIYLHRHGRSFIGYVVFACCGLAAPFALVVAFLLHHHALSSFVYVLRITLPYYAKIGRPGYGDLLQLLMTTSLWVLTLGALLIVLHRRGTWTWELKPRCLGVLVGHAHDEREWSTWEMKMVAVGIAFGAASYWGQGKGMHYHRYPLLAFLFLWIGLVVMGGMRERGFVRIASAALLVYALCIAPQYAFQGIHKVWSPAYIDALTADLNHLGGSELSGRVQCLSTQAECQTVLYRMRLVQSTGLFYDFLIFRTDPVRAIQVARQRFWQEWQANPPKVLVVNTDLYPLTDGYVKLDNWPVFRRELDEHYTLYDDRDYGRGQSGNMAYRIYLRRDKAAPVAPAH
jgi:hypothetical protein